MVFGVVLIGVGILMLLGQLGISGLIPPFRWWPTILFIVGAAQVLTAGRPRQVASGLSLMLVCLWFYACIYHWYGLTYRTAWPLLLVVFGGEMILASVLGRLWPAPARKQEEPHA
jgi:hypothetical protein